MFLAKKIMKARHRTEGPKAVGAVSHDMNCSVDQAPFLLLFPEGHRGEEISCVTSDGNQLAGRELLEGLKPTWLHLDLSSLMNYLGESLAHLMSHSRHWQQGDLTSFLQWDLEGQCSLLGTATSCIRIRRCSAWKPD